MMKRMKRWVDSRVELPIDLDFQFLNHLSIEKEKLIELHTQRPLTTEIDEEKYQQMLKERQSAIGANPTFVNYHNMTSPKTDPNRALVNKERMRLAATNNPSLMLYCPVCGQFNGALYNNCTECGKILKIERR